MRVAQNCRVEILTQMHFDTAGAEVSVDSTWGSGDHTFELGIYPFPESLTPIYTPIYHHPNLWDPRHGGPNFWKFGLGSLALSVGIVPIWGLPKIRGYHFGVPVNKDCGILRFLLWSPTGKLQNLRVRRKQTDMKPVLRKEVEDLKDEKMQLAERLKAKSRKQLPGGYSIVQGWSGLALEGASFL